MSGERKRRARISLEGLAVGDAEADNHRMAHASSKTLLKRISINPRTCGGKPCIRGHRIWVSLILDFLAGGMNEGDVLREYPQLSGTDIRACIAYGAEMSRARHVDVPVGRRH